MQTATHEALQRQLQDRRERLNAQLATRGFDGDLVDLLTRVDSALSRLEGGDYARCLICQGAVDEAELLDNPLLEYCLCRLSAGQQRALEKDLTLARRIQAGLLPDPDYRSPGWEAAYSYEPAGVVSGDFCDLWERPGEPDSLYFSLGDVSGKGVAASLLMAHLHATWRSMTRAGLPMVEMVESLNHQLLEAALPGHYATFVGGRAGAGGGVEIVNAGHCPPLLARDGRVEAIGATGFPLGLFPDRGYEVRKIHLGPGDRLLLYTDGLSEARGPDGSDFGVEPAERLLGRGPGVSSRRTVEDLRRGLLSHRNGAPPTDDLALMALRRLSPRPAAAGGS